MNRPHRSRIMAGLASAALLIAVPVAAKESSGTPAAKAFFAEGDAAAKAGKPADAAAAFRKAIEADPDFMDAHQRFIETTQRAENPNNRTLSSTGALALYTRWAREQPKRAAFQWALGLITTDLEKSDAYLRAALALDPAFARAHFQLAKNADLRGDWEAQRQHLEAAVKDNPDEPRYLVKYAQSYKRVDPARFRQLALSVVDKFPATPYAAEALYYVADASVNPERRALLERLRATYPPEKFGYSATAMYDFYDEATSPSEALSIAQQMSKVYPTSKTWARRVELQQAMINASELVAARKYPEAIDLLAKTERPSGAHGGTWALLKAEAAAGAGQREQAYTSLVESIAAAPDERLEAALVPYGEALNKTRMDIDADIWRARDAKAAPAAPFELPSDRGSAPVKLADYRGTVVLVAFWFPG